MSGALDPWQAPSADAQAFPDRWPAPLPSRRRWAPSSLAAASSVSAAGAWAVVVGVSAFDALMAEGDFGTVLVMIFVGVPVLLGGALIGGAVALVAAVAAIPLGVAWATAPVRPWWPLFTVLHAVVAWVLALVTLNGVGG